MRFATAVAERDRTGLRSLLGDDVDFKALTPGRFWEAENPEEVDAIVFDQWFAEADRVTAVVDVEEGQVVDTHRVGYSSTCSAPTVRTPSSSRPTTASSTTGSSTCGSSARGSGPADGSPRRDPLETRRGSVRCSGVVTEVAAEVRDGEGDPAALAGVDQALLQQRVAGG